MTIIDVIDRTKEFQDIRYGEYFVFQDKRYMRCSENEKKCGIAVSDNGELVHIPYTEIVGVCSNRFEEKVCNVPIGYEFRYKGELYIKTKMEKDGEYLCVNLMDGSVVYLSAEKVIEAVRACINLKWGSI